MYPFNAEEINLIAAFDTGKRTETLELMEDMKRLLTSVSERLWAMTDEEYNALDLAPQRRAMMPDSFEIWQLKKTDEGIRLLFMSSDFLARHDYTVDLNNYDRVYSGELKPGTSLEDLYTQFNLYHPEGFRGHSMSVSDLVILNQGGETTVFYCDKIGFTDVSDFVLEDYRKIRPSIRQRLKLSQEKQKEQPAQELSKEKVKENSL